MVYSAQNTVWWLCPDMLGSFQCSPDLAVFGGSGWCENGRGTGSEREAHIVPKI